VRFTVYSVLSRGGKGLQIDSVNVMYVRGSIQFIYLTHLPISTKLGTNVVSPKDIANAYFHF
jgi:hypothetical protein